MIIIIFTQFNIFRFVFILLYYIMIFSQKLNTQFSSNWINVVHSVAKLGFCCFKPIKKQSRHMIMVASQPQASKAQAVSNVSAFSHAAATNPGLKQLTCEGSESCPNRQKESAEQHGCVWGVRSPAQRLTTGSGSREKQDL